jgi:hypothetical protein
MPKQTAVEWLETELKKLPMVNVVEVFKEAKAMEREQIKDAWMDGMEGILHKIAAEQYYKETYHSVEPNEMINHIGEVNEMVEDDVEKLAVEEYPITKGGSMWMPTSFNLDQSCRQEGFKVGYNKAKKTYKGGQQ